MRNGAMSQLVDPHRASNEVILKGERVKSGSLNGMKKSSSTSVQSLQRERSRIIENGGSVFVIQGVPRVQGQSAVSRAIGDVELKPHISSEPDIVSFEMRGDEDFVIMGSDGLWDHVDHDALSSMVYNLLRTDPGMCMADVIYIFIYRVKNQFAGCCENCITKVIS